MLENLNENQVELVQVALFFSHRRFVRTALDDYANDEIPDTTPLVFRQDLPSTLDQLVHDLKGNVLCLRVA